MVRRVPHVRDRPGNTSVAALSRRLRIGRLFDQVWGRSLFRGDTFPGRSPTQGQSNFGLKRTGEGFESVNEGDGVVLEDDGRLRVER